MLDRTAPILGLECRTIPPDNFPGQFPLDNSPQTIEKHVASTCAISWGMTIGHFPPDISLNTRTCIMHTYMQAYTHIYIHTRMYTHMHIHTYKYVHTHTYMRTYTDIHT